MLAWRPPRQDRVAPAVTAARRMRDLHAGNPVLRRSAALRKAGGWLLASCRPLGALARGALSVGPGSEGDGRMLASSPGGLAPSLPTFGFVGFRPWSPAAGSAPREAARTSTYRRSSCGAQATALGPWGRAVRCDPLGAVRRGRGPGPDSRLLLSPLGLAWGAPCPSPRRLPSLRLCGVRVLAQRSLPTLCPGGRAGPGLVFEL